MPGAEWCCGGGGAGVGGCCGVLGPGPGVPGLECWDPEIKIIFTIIQATNNKKKCSMSQVILRGQI